MADFQAHLEEIESLGAHVVAASVDGREDGEAIIEELELNFPVAYGLDFLTFAEKTGAFYEVRRSILHATAFILRPDGTVATSVYASGPVGRLSGDDAVRILKSYSS